MELSILSVEDYEMVHYNSPQLFIAHKANVITYKTDKEILKIKMPKQFYGIKTICLFFRKSRRLLRLDKAMILPTDGGVVLFRQGEIWRYYFDNNKWVKTEVKLNCRNPMYNGLLRLPNGDILVGEYGNRTSIGKKIFKSTDGGSTWECVFTFNPVDIHHIHCLAWDPYEENIWVFTGDTDNECKILRSDVGFQNIETVGSGSQVYRACHALFLKDSIDWMMDSPLEQVRHVKFDRKTKEITLHDSFAGPIWFAQQLEDGTAIAASAQEIGPSHTDKKLHVYVTNDMLRWTEVASFEHDGWPKSYFRFGTMTFAKENRRRNDIYMSCEGVKWLDGKSIRVSVG